MNKELFVQNIKKYCELVGVKPTVACRESGVSSSFISNIESRNQTPSVEKVQMLANYLGVTVSELLGEEKTPSPASDESEGELLVLYRKLNQEGQEKLLDYADDLASSGKYKKGRTIPVDSKEA